MNRHDLRIGPPRRDLLLSAVDHPAGLGAGSRRPTRGHRRAAGVLPRGAECRRERRGAKRAAERSHPPERAPGTAAAHRSGDAPRFRRRDSTKGGVSGIRLGDDSSAARPRRRAPLPGGRRAPEASRVSRAEKSADRSFFGRRRGPDDERAETLVAEADGVEPADRERAHREEEGTPPFRRGCRSPESWPSGVASERNDRGPRTGRSPLREPARGGGGTLEAEIPTAPASGVGSRAVPSRPTAPAAGGGRGGWLQDHRPPHPLLSAGLVRQRPSVHSHTTGPREASHERHRRRLVRTSTSGGRVHGRLADPRARVMARGPGGLRGSALARLRKTTTSPPTESPSGLCHRLPCGQGRGARAAESGSLLMS